MRKKKENGSSADLPKVCCFCENASLINDEENVLCCKKGIVSREYKCRKFRYDPLKRVPKPLPEIPKLAEEDLVL